MCHSMPDEQLHQETLESLERLENHKLLILSEQFANLRGRLDAIFPRASTLTSFQG